MSSLDPVHGEQRAKFINTRKLAGAAVLVAGVSGLAAAPALAALDGYALDAHIPFPQRFSTGHYAHKYYANTGQAYHSGGSGRPIIFRSGSGGSFHSQDAPPGVSAISSGPYGRVHYKTLGCGAFNYHPAAVTYNCTGFFQ